MIAVGRVASRAQRNANSSMFAVRPYMGGLQRAYLSESIHPMCLEVNTSLDLVGCEMPKHSSLNFLYPRPRLFRGTGHRGTVNIQLARDFCL